ncbi:MAG: carbon-nitrogen family hydrolase [Eubacterium sp.]|nr:carbon-nitrogen family hydrolase [Eubacterium sp.]
MIRIGLGQMDMAWEAIEENKRKVDSFLKEAKEKEVDLIIFPEMTMTGFSMDTSMAVYYEDQNRFFAGKAAEYGISIIYGIIAPGQGEKFENHLVMVDEKGKRVLEYAKIHPFSYGAEGEYYTGGDKVVACRWHDTVLSGFICYDIRFPQIFQTASGECQLIIVIANFPMERICHWDTLLKARAIENSCFVAGVNRTGKAGRQNYNGHSAVYDYLGEPVTGIREEECLIIADIDPAKVQTFREYFPAVIDRRPDLYRKLRLEFYPQA